MSTKTDLNMINTPLKSSSRLGRFLGLKNSVYFKREDKNQTGSYKDRSFEKWISKICSEKKEVDQFVISSSGNAAISATFYCMIFNKSLKIYLSKKSIEKHKLKKLEKLIAGKMKIGKWQSKSLIVNLQKYSFEEIKSELKIKKEIEIDNIFKPLSEKIKILLVDKPKKEAIKESIINQNIINLRGSVNKYAVLGYKKISKELINDIKQFSKKEITDIFLPVSSGTGAIGVYQGFQEEKEKGNIKNIPRFYLCQTTQNHFLLNGLPLNTLLKPKETEEYKPKQSKEKHDNQPSTIVPAICDKICYRKKDIHEIIKRTKGKGIILNNQEIRKALYLANLKGQAIGKEGGLAFAGLIKISRKKLKIGLNPVVLVTGK